MLSPPRIPLVVAAVLAILSAAGAAAGGPSARPVSIRIHYGGGTPQAWTGRIAVVPDAGGLNRPETDGASGRGAIPLTPFSWRTLCTEPDAATLTRDEAGGIAIAQPRPIGNDGVELTVRDWKRSRLVVQLSPATAAATAVELDLPLAEILAGPVQRPLDNDGNRLTVAAAPGDELRVTLAAAGGGLAAATAVRRPGDVVRFHVDPLLAIAPGEAAFELRLRLTRAREEKVIDSQLATLVPLDEPPAASSPSGFASGRVPTCFRGVDFELSLPQADGVYEVTLEAVERGGLRWTRPLATRTLQVVAIDPAAADPDATRAEAAAWDVVYELDPGSPKLHERLRRLPVRGLSAVPVPAITLPTMPLPSLSRPRLPLPRLPDVPLPSVGLPNVSAMVPRFGGLLATGHSVAVPHDLGPLLRLPPGQPGEPAWEGIVVAGVQPGLPHLVEIEYPAAQQATVAVCVLEPDATGATVEVRHAGGFAAAGAGEEPLARHRFAFWPTSRNPLIVIANTTATPALVGRVRVTAGPRRLPAAAPTTGASAGRPTLAMLGTPDLHRRFGGPAIVAASGGRPVADWVAHLAGIRHSADALAAAGLAGGVVVAYGDGAAAWPSQLTRQAARWDPASASDAGLDLATKDLLAAIAEVYGREGLKLVPAFSFTAAIPALEALLAGEDAPGIACVGADGRPRRLPGGTHYNILDPRVQRAVEAIVTEAAGRLAGMPATAGLALLLPHDGWLHLPGVAWGLDDATFGRFLATIGGEEAAAGPERFAERARLVTGSLREEWLAWRAGEVTAFYARLTAAVAAIDDRWPLYVAPTTLFAAGDLAAGFRPALADADAGDLIREAGLVTTLPPQLVTAGRLVFMSPFVEAAGGRLEERSTVSAANAALALARAASAAAARGVVVVSRPVVVDLSAVVPYGPFGTATPPGPITVTPVPPAAAGDRALAESLVAADAEAVFDARAAVTFPPTPTVARRAFETLPPGGMSLAADLPAPLAVRTSAAGGATRVAVVNAGPVTATAVLGLAGKPSAVLDAVDGGQLPLEPTGSVAVPLPAWGVRSLVIDGGVSLTSARVVYDEPVRADVARRIERLRRRLAVLERPAALDVLDNPGFELGLDAQATPGTPPAITGWELVEPRRGSLRLVTGMADEAARPTAAAGRGLEFSSRHGLSTLRSNPFPPPDTGRISVAVWLRVKPGDPQPPLRMALEGLEGGREYYRFAAVGGLTGGRPLTPTWSLFVLQVDDLPTDRVESLRVRFDLLGPGGVEIDDVRVFDLAFDAEQRARLAKQLARIDHRFKQGDVGAAVVALADHWPAFLETFIDDAAVAAVARQAAPPPRPAEPAAEPRQGMLDRLRGWWR
jgi:hypothetical protein